MLFIISVSFKSYFFSFLSHHTFTEALSMPPKYCWMAFEGFRRCVRIHCADMEYGVRHPCDRHFSSRQS